MKKNNSSKERCKCSSWFFSATTLAVGLSILFVVSPAQAYVTLVTPDEFIASTTIIDFEAFPNGDVPPYSQPILTNQWVDMGVIISDSSPANGAQVASTTYGVQPHSGRRAMSNATRREDGSPRDEKDGFVQVHFVVPGTTIPSTVEEAGVWVQNGDTGSTVLFYDIEGHLITSIPTSGNVFFAGIRATEGIGSVRIVDVGHFTVDDLEFSVVPEPCSFLLIGLGGIILRRRKA